MRESPEFDAIVAGQHRNPFSVLGLHRAGKKRVVRTFQPGAEAVELLNAGGEVVARMRKVHPAGVFEADVPPRMRRYRFHVTYVNGDSQQLEDAYGFPSTLGELDLYLLGEGSDRNAYEKLGAHVITVKGVTGTRFAVWAPNAARVSVVGDFNGWDGRIHVMRLHPANGIWEIFIPGAGSGSHYKFELTAGDGKLLPLKSDPYAAFHEAPPGNASIVYDSAHTWTDGAWMRSRGTTPKLDEPVAIYEVHLGSWRRKDDNGYLSYRELAVKLVEYVLDMGFTHIEMLPVSEHPFEGSWGYQPIGLFAPTQRFGTPDDFRFLVDCCHAAGIGVIIDWVPAHFPRDEHGLAMFDGTALFEHADPRKGAHADWGTLIFNYGRREVINYLISSALCWINDFHVDGVRVDAVASMLYLDYSREDGEWLPNEHGGNENLEAVEFLKKLNIEIHAAGAVSYAEESTAWPGVSSPVESGGLGFTYKWNMGWMNDTLSYMSEDPLNRKYHHDKMTFGLVYAFDENFVLPLSHDEVVHGKRSLIERMPGDDWQKFANLRAYFAAMYAHPGKKLLFMGSEIAQRHEWDHDVSLDWHLLDHPPHLGMQRMVRDLNSIYKSTPALYECDFESSGFAWLDWEDGENSVLSWRRSDPRGGSVLCICNLTPVVRHDYRVGAPGIGDYMELLNTDDASYGGTNLKNAVVTATNAEHKGWPASMLITLPPLATIYLAQC